MKSLLVALALVSAVPAFASEEASLTQAEVDLSFEADWNRDGDGRDGRDRDERDRDWRRPGHGREQFVCVATNYRGERFRGSSFSRERAAQEALQECRYGSRYGLGRSCRVQRCFRDENR
ncbi:MAG TPA: hypothetical protein VIH99_12565 [Bdellovibrionota bacterium]|jgi:hypothetical protein